VQPLASTLVWTLMVAFFLFWGSLASTLVDTNSAPISVHFPLDANNFLGFSGR
jgi:hypothetical protein